MKVSFKYLRKYQSFWHYWSIVFKKDYKYGNLSYHWMIFENDIDTFLYKHFKSYHSQGLFAWLYNRFYVLCQYFTPFLKWSRWTFIQCQHNSGKYITDNTNYVVRKTTSSPKTAYYHFLTMFGYLKVVEKCYVDANGETKSLFVMNIMSMCDLEVPEVKEVKRTIFSGFIFTKKQALKAIEKIKSNTCLGWDSDYCDISTYFIDRAIKDNTLFTSNEEDNYSYIRTDITNYLSKYDDTIISNLLEQIDVYASDNIKKYESQILERLKSIQEKMKNNGYISFSKNDFNI